MKAIQLALFPRSAVTGPRSHCAYTEQTPSCCSRPDEASAVLLPQSEELPFDEDGDDQ